MASSLTWSRAVHAGLQMAYLLVSGPQPSILLLDCCQRIEIFAETVRTYPSKLRNDAAIGAAIRVITSRGSEQIHLRPLIFNLLYF